MQYRFYIYIAYSIVFSFLFWHWFTAWYKWHRFRKHHASKITPSSSPQSHTLHETQ